MKIIRNHCLKGCIFWNGVNGEDMAAIKTQMNIYQNFLQTNTKTGKLFKTGFNFLKFCFSFIIMLWLHKNNTSESWQELLLLQPFSVKMQHDNIGSPYANHYGSYKIIMGCKHRFLGCFIKILDKKR